MGQNRATSSDPDELPALPPPQDRGDGEPRERPGARVTKSYTPSERLVIMMCALRDGLSQTARRREVPRGTIASWFSEYGGIGEVQERLTDEAFGDFLAAERSIYDAVVRRADELPADELMVSFRKLVEARLIPTLTGVDGNGQPAAAAAAKATVELLVTEKDGKVTVVDLGAPPEDESE